MIAENYKPFFKYKAAEVEPDSAVLKEYYLPFPEIPVNCFKDEAVWFIYIWYYFIDRKFMLYSANRYSIDYLELLKFQNVNKKIANEIKVHFYHINNMIKPTDIEPLKESLFQCLDIIIEDTNNPLIDNIEMSELIKFLAQPDNFRINYKLFKELGIDDDLKAVGITYNPFHDYNLLLDTRLKIFIEKTKLYFKEKQKYNSVVDKMDTYLFYKRWLYDELKEIEKWLSGNLLDSQIGGIERYKVFVNNAIKKIENEIEIEIDPQDKHSLQNISLKSDPNDIKETNIINPADNFYKVFFDLLDNDTLSTKSISWLYSIHNDILQKFIDEILDKLDEKDSDAGKIIYIDKIKNQFKKYIPQENSINDIYNFYKRNRDNWCNHYKISYPLVMNTYGNELIEIFDASPEDFIEGFQHIPRAKEIRTLFYYFIRFNSIKVINDLLTEKLSIINKSSNKDIESLIKNTNKLNVTTSYYTEKALAFINNQFKKQIQYNSLTKQHLIRSNYKLLDFDNSRNEIRKYHNTKEIKTLNHIYTLAKENFEMYKSKIQHLTGKEDGYNVLNLNTRKSEHRKNDIEIQRYKINEADITYVLAPNYEDFDRTPLRPFEIFDNLDNYDLALFSSSIIDYIDEIRSIYSPQQNNSSILNRLIGFNNNLQSQQIENLYIEIQGKFIDSNIDNFKAIFSNNSLPQNFMKVKWILLNRDGNPHKTALREFLTLLLGKCPSQKIIDTCITDNNGHSIKLAKPKASEYSNYYIDFTTVFSKSCIKF